LSAVRIRASSLASPIAALPASFNFSLTLSIAAATSSIFLPLLINSSIAYSATSNEDDNSSVETSAALNSAFMA
jgi:hypothetical protein